MSCELSRIWYNTQETCAYSCIRRLYVWKEFMVFVYAMLIKLCFIFRHTLNMLLYCWSGFRKNCKERLLNDLLDGNLRITSFPLTDLWLNITAVVSDTTAVWNVHCSPRFFVRNMNSWKDTYDLGIFSNCFKSKKNLGVNKKYYYS